jgi:hypothetical protein
MSETGSVKTHFLWDLTDLSGKQFSKYAAEDVLADCSLDYAPTVGQQVRHVRNLQVLGIVLKILPGDAQRGETYKVLWSDSFSDHTFAFPRVRRQYSQLIANDIVSIQPMSLPAGLIFYLDYTYGSGSKT